MPSKRTRLIAGNWKMNNDLNEAKDLAQALVAALPEIPEGVEVCVCPPTVDLRVVSCKGGVKESPIKLGAQNVYWEASGAYTGETSVAMLKSVPVEYCIIGHSERRDYFKETDEDENKKAKALIAGGIVPIFCCGESLDQLVIAYEPIWAIGTGKTATADDAQEVCGAIRATLVEIFGQEIADGIRVLYGGSAKPENIAGFLEKEDVDGALVGGASLKADSFAAMVEKAGE